MLKLQSALAVCAAAAMILSTGALPIERNDSHIYLTGVKAGTINSEDQATLKAFIAAQAAGDARWDSTVTKAGRTFHTYRNGNAPLFADVTSCWGDMQGTMDEAITSQKSEWNAHHNTDGIPWCRVDMRTASSS